MILVGGRKCRDGDCRITDGIGEIYYERRLSLQAHTVLYWSSSTSTSHQQFCSAVVKLNRHIYIYVQKGYRRILVSGFDRILHYYSGLLIRLPACGYRVQSMLKCVPQTENLLCITMSNLKLSLIYSREGFCIVSHFLLIKELDHVVVDKKSTPISLLYSREDYPLLSEKIESYISTWENRPIRCHKP